MEARVRTMGEISMLINMGKWKQAQHELASKEEADSDTSSAHYWLARSLVERLLSNTDQADLYVNQAKKCDDWTDVLDGDNRRDSVLTICRRLARQSKWRKDRQLIWLANEQLSAAEQLFGQDENRQASLLMTRARLSYALERYAEAVWIHRLAAVKWASLPDADEQWIRNNRFHWLKASRSTSQLRYELWQGGEARRLLLAIMEDPGEIQPKRKLMALAIFIAGRPACSFYDLIAP